MLEDGNPREERLPSASRRSREDDSFAPLRLRVVFTTIKAHWKLILLVWLITLGVMLRSALNAEPVYEAVATVKIDPYGGAREGQLGYVSWWEVSTSAATEVRVMSSWPVAQRAAARPEAGVTAAIVEVGAYRPLDVMLRSFRGGWSPCELRAYAPVPQSGETAYKLTFSGDGRSLTVVGPDGAERTYADFVFAEVFDDLNGNRERDPGESFEDRDGNGTYDTGETFVDLDRNGVWDAAEHFEDRNGNGRWDPGDFFEDLDLDKKRDENEPFIDLDRNDKYTPPETLVDRNQSGDWDAAEPFDDRNSNEHYDPAEPYTDDNKNGRWDAPETFEDADGDGEYRVGTTIMAGSVPVRLARLRGNPAGREFSLTLRSLHEAAEWIQAGVSAESLEEYTGVVALGFQADTPAASARVANAVVDGYLEFKRHQKSAEYQNKSVWLREAVTKLSTELGQLERERDEYVKRKRAVLVGERAQAILAERGELIREQFELQQALRNLDFVTSDLRAQKTAEQLLLRLGAEVIDPRTVAIAEKLTDLETRRRSQLLTGGARADSPHILKLDREIRALETDLDQRVRLLRDGRLEQLAEQRQSLERRITDLEKESKRQQELLLELPDKQRGVAARTRIIDEKASAYRDLVSALRESELARESLVPAVTALNPARAPGGRKSPNLFRAALSGLILGLIFGLGLAFLAEALRNTLRSPEELEAGLGLRVLGAVPAYESLPRRVRRLVSKQGLVTRDVPSSAVAEAYRSLSASVRFGEHGREIKTLAITSALAGEGKTITLLNLAVVMARAGASVIVVDADLRRSRVHQYFGVGREPGLSDAVSGAVSVTECLQPSGVDGLQILPAGTPNDNPGALLESQSFDPLLAELADLADYVLIDCPPVLGVADPAAFFRQVDGVMLLVRSGMATAAAARAALDQVTSVGGRPIGAVLNGLDLRRISRRGEAYHGYYGYYD